MNKRVLIPLVLASVMLVSATAFAVTDAEIQACFKAHSQLMEKPALRNLYTCWRVHGYLMKRHQQKTLSRKHRRPAPGGGASDHPCSRSCRQARNLTLLPLFV